MFHATFIALNITRARRQTVATNSNFGVTSCFVTGWTHPPLYAVTSKKQNIILFYKVIPNYYCVLDSKANHARIQHQKYFRNPQSTKQRLLHCTPDVSCFTNVQTRDDHTTKISHVRNAVLQGHAESHNPLQNLQNLYILKLSNGDIKHVKKLTKVRCLGRLTKTIITHFLSSLFFIFGNDRPPPILTNILS